MDSPVELEDEQSDTHNTVWSLRADCLVGDKHCVMSVVSFHVENNKVAIGGSEWLQLGQVQGTVLHVVCALYI